MIFEKLVYVSIHFICACVFILLATEISMAQTESDSTSTEPQVAQRSKAPAVKKSNVKDAVEFQSSDSLTIDLRQGRKAFLFGSAKVSHSAGELTAGEIEMDIEKNQVEAHAGSATDTLSYPVLKRDTDEIKSTRILFNYQTQKGKFEEAKIQVPDGYLIGSKVKNVNKDEVFIEDGIYSTCPPDYLYYYIKAKKMKVVEQEEVFFANARLYILDIPYPILFPFGYVPSSLEQRRSGLLTPTYAFEAQSSRGIGLQNLGWFQYFNDYLTGQVSTDVFTSGTFYANSNFQYRKRDKFNGNVQIGYSRDQGLEKTDPSFTTTVQKSLSINHNQDFSPYSRINAGINLRTRDFFTRNSYDIDDRATTTSTSKLAYNYSHPENDFNFSINSQLTQDFNNNTTTLTGPNSTFSLKTLTPFKSNESDDPKWYESITLRYNNTFNSRFQYNPIDADSAEVTFLDALFDPSQYREATGNNEHYKFGFQQTASVGVGKLLSSPYLNLSGNANFNEYWYPTTTRQTFNADSNRVETEKVRGFAAARDFNLGLSFSTTFYGVSNKKLGKFEGLRHTITPSLSYSYSPDFSDEQWGFYKTVQTDTLGNTRKYSIFSDEIFGGPGAGERQAVTFSLRNVFETKIVSRDTTGEVSEKKLKLIDNLSASTSYNFAADSLNFSNITTSLSSNAINGINISARANFSLYQVDSVGRAFDRFLIEDRDKLAQLQNFSISASTSFRGGSNGPEVYTPVYRKTYDPYNQSRFSPIDPHFNREPVTPLNSPWSFSLNFDYRWTYQFNEKPRKSATLNANSISFRLTPKWRFNTRMGYDFIQKELTPSQFGLTRNLECWDLTFQVNPFGENQYYFFRLTLNSAQVQSLFQKLPILKNLERSSSPSGRGYNRY
ncbi:MAG: putative LPS assembly protein LptD [Balneola sp.]